MRILHVANNDIGGAGRAMMRLHQGLLEEGVDSRVLVSKKKSSQPKVSEWKGDMSFASRLERRSRKWWINRCERRRSRDQPPGFERFSDDRTRFGDHIVDDLNRADIVNFHWISQFVDHGKVFPRLKVPVVWTLHDQNPFTGGCHYDFGCERWRVGCGSCPQLGTGDPRDDSNRIWERKRSAYRLMEQQIHIVTPSNWLGQLAQESPLLGENPVRVIPNGVPTDIFHPGAREGFRAAFRIGEQDRVILFVSDNLANRRKGFPVLLEALKELPVDDSGRVVVLSVGAGSGDDLGEIEHHHLGSLAKEEMVAAVFSAADLFVAPALQDNLPNTMLESLACGTPIVGAQTGGIPDAVRPGETGWLFEAGNAESLREVLLKALWSEGLPQMRKECRKAAETQYSMEIQAKGYVGLYHDILDKKNGIGRRTDTSNGLASGKISGK